MREARQRQPRRGITLIELIVVIAVVGLLAALTLVGVQAARGAARRAQCANNLRQLGLALNAYATSIQGFPQGTYPSGYSVFVMLLPYLDQSVLYDAMNMNHFFHEAVNPVRNRTVARVQLAVLLCPADHQPPSKYAGITSYAGNRGGGVQAFGYNGAFGDDWKGPTSFADFTDGLSHTVAMSEWAIGTGTGDKPAHPLRATFKTPATLPKRAQFEDFAAMCRALDPRDAAQSGLPKGCSWFVGEFSYTLYNHVLGPNEHTCSNGGGVQIGAWTAGSFHNQGVNVLFCDGSTRYVKQQVALPLWRAMASRNGGEAIGD